MSRDSVPFTVIGVFVLMLIVVWSLETIYDSGPCGPTKQLLGGGTMVQVVPAYE